MLIFNSGKFTFNFDKESTRFLNGLNFSTFSHTLFLKVEIASFFCDYLSKSFFSNFKAGDCSLESLLEPELLLKVSILSKSVELKKSFFNII